MRLGILLAAVLAGGLAAGAARAADCEEGRETRRELKRLDDESPLTDTKIREWQKVLEELLARRPDDVFLHLEYQWAARGRTVAERNALIERYKGLAEKHAGNSMYEFLYASALIHSNTPEAIARLKQVALTGGNYPLAHLGLTKIYAWGKFADRPAMRSELNAYYDACPASLDATARGFLQQGATPEMAAKYEGQFRERLKNERDPEFLTGWQTVWNLEFLSYPPQQHDEVRQRLAIELERLRKQVKVKKQQWLSILRAGYKLDGDKARRTEVEDCIVAQYPQTFEATRISEDRWSEEHPYPKSEDPEATKQAFHRAQLARADQQLKKNPTDFEGLQNRFYALISLDDATPEQMATAGEALRQGLRGDPGINATPPFEFQIAKEYLRNKVRVEEVPSLVEEGWRSYRAYDGDFVSDRDPGEFAKNQEQVSVYLKVNSAMLLVTAAMQLQKPEIGKAAVEGLGEARPNSRFLEPSWWEVKAKWAELNGRKLDAMLMYRAAVDSRPIAFKQRSKDKDEAEEGYDRLWKEMGGTEEGKETWLKSSKHQEVAREGGWEKPEKELPAWELSDLEGKTWKLVELKGKTLLINVWATWCGPCREEHPYLQKLYEKTKDRTDIQIVTFNVDDEIGDVAPYLKENKFTFPVLLAKDFVDELISGLGVPQNWIVDTNGKWRWEQIGFGDGVEWEKSALGKLGPEKTE